LKKAKAMGAESMAFKFSGHGSIHGLFSLRRI